MNKNEKMLASFTEYCNKYPEQRFWQALRNWTQQNLDHNCGFIYMAPGNAFTMMMEGLDKEVVDSLKDTFYIEDDELGLPREQD